MRVLICDDDALLRLVIRSVVEAAGHEVIAETDTAVGASDLVHRFAPDVVVLDLALAAGLGNTVIEEAKRSRSLCRVVVFSAYASDHASLLKSGADAVIDKPRFDEMETLLREWGALAPGERRVKRVDRAPGAAMVRSPSGLEESRDFYTALAASQPGDVLITFRLEDFDALARRAGEVIGMDWILLLARVVRASLRDDDRLACFDGRHVHALLTTGGGPGLDAVVRRVTEAWLSARGPAGPRFSSSHAIQDGATPADVLLKRAAIH